MTVKQIIVLSALLALSAALFWILRRFRQSELGHLSEEELENERDRMNIW